MRIALFGTRGLRTDVEGIRGRLTCSSIITVHGVDGFGILGEYNLNVDSQTRYVSQAVLSADRLISMDSSYRLNSNACLIAYDMPLIVQDGDCQPFFSRGRRCVGFGSVTRNMCRVVLSAAYEHIGFDMVFVFGDEPDDGVLEYNGVIKRGRAAIHVADFYQVTVVLNSEGL